MERLFDARNMPCPLPVVNAKKETEQMVAGDVFVILVDNEVAVQNLSRFGQHRGYSVHAERISDREYRVRMDILSGEQPEQEASLLQEEEVSCLMDQKRKGMIVVLSSDCMGDGEKALGKALMKSFVFALTKQDLLPEMILCYNSGAYLSCEGADTLEDLQLLEAEGVTVLTCGTCLDFYGIKDRLSVGTVTNMYEIVELMEGASRIIRP